MDRLKEIRDKLATFKRHREQGNYGDYLRADDAEFLAECIDGLEAENAALKKEAT